MKFLAIGLFSIFIISCGNGSEKKTATDPYNHEPKLIIETDFGNMEIILYDATPLHRNNFIKLASENYYDGTLFHRVIENFMIQGGDPDSRNAETGDVLGSGGPDYTIPAEISDTIYHKKGAIAAARMGDNVNPEKESSGSQFYIVHGTIFTDEQLDRIEHQNNNAKLQDLFSEIFEKKEKKLLELGEEPDYNTISREAREEAEKIHSEMKPFSFSCKAREIYRTIGGAPHLDGSYTVFGEVVAGFEIIDKIASVPVDSNDRPLEDIRMNIKLVR